MKAINLWTGEKLFARKDYEGLNKENAERLRDFRKTLADSIRSHRDNNVKFAEEYPTAYKKITENMLSSGKKQSASKREILLKKQVEALRKSTVEENIKDAAVKGAERAGSFKKKLAIAAGVAGLGYGGYRLLKKKKKD